MILQKLLSNKNCKKYCLSLAVVFAIALAVVGRATFGGVVSEYNMPYSEWTTSMFFLQGAMVTVYSIVFTALFAIPLGFISSAPIVRIKRQRANRGRPVLSAYQQREALVVVMIVMMVVVAMGVISIVNNASR